MNRTRLTPLFFAFAAACNALPGQDDWQPVSFVDEGTVCFAQQDSDISISVTAPGCMSSSCSRNFAGSCAATVSGTEIALTSDIAWEQNEGDVACTDDCGIPTTSCDLTGLADGSYTVTFGDQTFALTVPVADPCATL
jgi:hypothetical protein